MGIFGWLSRHGFELLQTVSIVTGLFATAYTIHVQTKERKIQNLLALNSGHRELWMRFVERPELHRITLSSVDLKIAPPTVAERRFVHLLILHSRAAFKARKAGMHFADDLVSADVRQFFARPIPKVVWEYSKKFQDPDFVRFIEQNLTDESEKTAS